MLNPITRLIACWHGAIEDRSRRTIDRISASLTGPGASPFVTSRRPKGACVVLIDSELKHGALKAGLILLGNKPWNIHTATAHVYGWKVDVVALTDMQISTGFCSICLLLMAFISPSVSHFDGSACPVLHHALCALIERGILCKSIVWKF